MCPTVRGRENARAKAVADAHPAAVWAALGRARGQAAVQSVIDWLEGRDRMDADAMAPPALHAAWNTASQEQPLARQQASRLRDMRTAQLGPLCLHGAPVADSEQWQNILAPLATTPAGGGLSALTVIVEAAKLARPVEPDRRPSGIFPASLAAVRTVAPDPDTSRLPLALDAPALLGCAPDGSWLPGVDGTSETGIVRPALPLLLLDGAGLASMTRGTAGLACVCGDGVGGAARPAVRRHADRIDAPRLARVAVGERRRLARKSLAAAQTGARPRPTTRGSRGTTPTWAGCGLPCASSTCRAAPSVLMITWCSMSNCRPDQTVAHGSTGRGCACGACTRRRRIGPCSGSPRFGIPTGRRA